MLHAVARAISRSARLPRAPPSAAALLGAGLFAFAPVGRADVVGQMQPAVPTPSTQPWGQGYA